MNRVLSCLLLVTIQSLISIVPCSAQTFSFTHDNILRSYIVHLPTNYNPVNKYPLVLNLHGLTNTAAIQQTYTGMNTVADTGNFVLIYPDGISSSWNAGFGSPYNSGIDDVGFLNALLDTAIANYSIDTMRMYSCGMSNGAYMSYRLACELEHRIAAIASVTGSMPDSMEYYCQNNRAVPVMQVHGTTDPTVNYNGGPGFWGIETTIDYWVQKNNCPTTAVLTPLPDISFVDFSTVEKFYYGLCDENTEVVLYKITGGGHTWPGAIPIPVLGNTNQDFNASGEIWDFFRKFTLPLITNPNSVPDEKEISKIAISPNPGSDLIKVEGIDFSNSKVQIVTMMGQIVSELEIGAGYSQELHLDISNIDEGMYVIRITNRSGQHAKLMMKY